MSPLRTICITLAFLLGMGLFSACIQKDKIAMRSTDCNLCEKTQSYLLPLQLGMTKNEVAEKFPSYEPILDCTHAAELSPGVKVSLRNGASVLLAFDKNNKVFSISTSDAGIPLPAQVQMGQAYGVVIRKFPTCEVRDLRGYGEMLKICPHVWLGFTSVSEIGRNERPLRWVVLRSKEF